MKRRDFFKNTALAGIGASLLSPELLFAKESFYKPESWKGKNAKNIIFLVSDGMSSGTLNMTDILMRQKFGRHSNWIQLYKDNRIHRALMDTASASSFVTDSAAASSSWGGGFRINNGALNIGVNGENYKPILQKFKDAGKAVGCVTTVPVTHATPAGFCINNKSRKNQPEIALQYLPLKFDVMMGAGTEFFSKELRKDNRDVFGEYISSGYTVVKSRKEMMSAAIDKPILGVFHKEALPFTVDRNNDKSLQEAIPTLAEMTTLALQKMSTNNNGFVLQVEGGRVDYAAHGNDIAGLLYDQVAFDEAVEVAIKFAEKNEDTLVIITTDHGNSNPGLVKGDDKVVNVNANFDKAINFKHSNYWVLQGVNKTESTAQLIERIEYAQNIVIDKASAASLLKYYKKISGTVNNYDYKELPFELLAQIQKQFTSVGWVGDDHTGDFVELAMYGPGSDQLLPFVKNTDLHYFMLAACGVKG